MCQQAKPGGSIVETLEATERVGFSLCFLCGRRCSLLCLHHDAAGKDTESAPITEQRGGGRINSAYFTLEQNSKSRPGSRSRH